MAYHELLMRSNFSFLTGASHPEELVQTAIETGLGGCAIVDSNGLYSLGRAYKIAKHHPGFNLIIGSEITFLNDLKIVILVKNKRGYGLLCRLLTQVHQERPPAKKKTADALDRDELMSFAQQNNAWNDWIVLPHLLEKIPSLNKTAAENFQALKALWEKIFCLKIPHLYLPLVRYLDGFDSLRTQMALQLSREWQVPIVASNDVYYHHKERKQFQDLLIAIRENQELKNLGFKLFSNAERFIKSPAAMAQLFADLPEAITNTEQIAALCTFSPKELRYRYPSEWIPANHSSQSYLEELVKQNAPLIYKGAVPFKVEKQLAHELGLIAQLNYADYFLTIYDIVDFARKQNILCQGRGSAANSVVCFILGITAIDPVQMNLLFERFISVERNEPPDIDVDFEHERREEVIQYIYNKYGRDRAAMLSAVVTYQWRSAFRDVCKAFGVPVGTLSAKKVEQQFDELAQQITTDADECARLRLQINHFAQQLCGFPRHLSIHSGGFTLSADPIVEIVPVQPARMPGRTIIQWDKYDLDELGLLKVDILALGMLSALRKTLKLVDKKLYEIPHNDAATYQMIQQGDTVGTFQIESRAQMSMLGRLQPQNFYDLVIEVAIVRPGPIVGKMIHPYLKRRKGLEQVYFPNAKVEAILGKTLGIPLFQEQIMKLAIDLAHFSPGEADLLRKSISAWRSSAPIAKMAERLMKGLIESGLPQSFAEQIFEQIQGFSQYGFPESHAASFALLAYASCYLKCHHPAEFAASLINSQPLGFYRNDTLVYDALRHGVKVLPVCVQRSQWDCTIEEPNTIRLGFRVVKGISFSDVQELQEARLQKPFTNLAEFLQRSSLRKDVIHRLALAGRLSSQNLGPRQTLWSILEYENLGGRNKLQADLFDDYEIGNSDSNQTKADALLKSNAHETIPNDYKAFGLSTHGHPMSDLRQLTTNLALTNSKKVKQQKHGSRASVAGMVLVRQKPPTANGVVFSTIEDEYGFVDLILHQETYQRYQEVFRFDCFICVSGVIQKDGNTVSMLVEEVKAISEKKASNLHHVPDARTYFY